MNALRTFSLAALLAATPALAAVDKAVSKPVNTLIQAIKQDRDELALKQFASDEQGRRLVGAEEWAKASDAQKKEFTTLFNRLFAAIAFPKFDEYFKYLDAVNFSATQVTGRKATADSVILIDHPVKKQEMKVKFELLQAGGAWKVVDAGVQGSGMDSMIATIRDDNKLPDLVAKEGIEGLLKVMRDRLAKVEAKQKK